MCARADIHGKGLPRVDGHLAEINLRLRIAIVVMVAQNCKPPVMSWASVSTDVSIGDMLRAHAVVSRPQEKRQIEKQGKGCHARCHESLLPES